MNVQLTPAQKAFCDSPALYRGFVGGRGAGKSWVGAYDMLRRAMAPGMGGRLYGAYAPTYGMLRDATWRTYLELGGMLHCIGDVNRSDLRLTLGNRSEILFRSMDDPERTRGANLSGAHLDEASLMAKEAHTVVIACLREGGTAGWESATFTPKGKSHWTYDVFGQGQPNTDLFHSGTLDNPFLPPEFFGAVRSQYTAAFAEQELQGEFIDLGGTILQREWFGIVEAVPEPLQRVRYWDFAATEDGGAYTAGVKIGVYQKVFYVEDVVHGQWSSLHRDRAMLNTAQQDTAAHKAPSAIWFEQEPGSSGVDTKLATVQMLAGYPIYADKVTGSKDTRLMPFAAQAEAGNVKLLRGAWNADWLDELSSVPNGKYRDQADATAGAFNKLVGAGQSITVQDY